MKLKLILVALTLSFSSISIASDSAEDAIKMAKAAQKEASALGFEWRDMRKNIKKAEAAAAKGNNKKAIKLAKIVSGQLEAIRKQAELAKNAGPNF